ncbi:MAG: TIGR04141 family sporadically distributed protein, partial [Candidatus Aminicenantes bacterium]|nr:TIGR04141 family sporadically distributed protein [Candidatus Aminicenantes bacterium]
MKKNYVMLNAFRLHDTMDGEDIGTFDDFLVDDHGPLKIYDLRPGFPFKARLYVSGKEDKEPPWAEYLRSGFAELPKIINIVTNRALLIIAVKFGDQKIHFGFSFGFGRYFLKSSSYVRNYGLTVALNAIYRGIPKKGIVDFNLIQSLDVKTVSANTIHTRRQSNRRTAFEMFGVDIQRDILRSITGRPAGETEWGTRISGSDAVTIACPVDFKDLGERCKLIETLYRRTDYKDYFSWIDHIKVVTDPRLKEELESEMQAKLIKKDIGNLELAPPEIVDWDRIKCFRFSFDPDQTYEELELGPFLAALDSKEKLKGLSIKQLKSVYRIEALDNNDEPVGNWNALQCLCGELSYKNQSYILEGNDFSAVDDRYRKDVDTYVESIKEYVGKFPKCAAKWHEDDFNIESGKYSEYLLLHKQNVRLPEKTTPIEVCDLLSDDHCFIHVKPKFSSSTLSHLFSQGYISGELLCTSPDFRKQTLAAISDA